MHFHPNLAVAAARFAASALDVEAEAPRLITAFTRVGRHGEDIADFVENLGIGGRVGARRPADGRLVDGDDALDGLRTFDAPDAAGLVHADALRQGQMLVQRIHHKRAFARAGNAGHARQRAEGNGAVDVLEVVGGHAAQGQPAVRFPALVGNRDGEVAAHVFGGQRVRMLDEFGEGTVKDHVPPVRARTGPQLDDVVGLADGGLVMLHDQHRVPASLQVAQGGDEALIVARVQADGRFVKHVGHAHEPGTELRGQPDALGLPAGKGGHGPAKGDVVKAHVGHEGQAVIEFLEQRLRDEGMAAVEGALVQPAQGAFHGHGAEIEDADPIHAYRERFGPQARAVAGGAVHALEVAGEQIAPHVAVLHPAFEQRDDARPCLGPEPVWAVVRLDVARQIVRGRGEGHRAAQPVAAQAAFARFLRCRSFAVEKGVQGVRRVVGKRRGQAKAVPFAEGDERLLVAGEGLGIGPRQNGLGVQGQAPIGRDEHGLEILDGPEPRAARTGPLRAVEGKKLRAGRGQADLADRADRFRGVQRVAFLSLVRLVDDDPAFPIAQGQFHRVGQPSPDAVLDHEAVDHQIDGVLLVLVQRGDIVHAVELAVHAYADKAFRLQFLEAVEMSSLLKLHERGHDDDLRAFRQGEDVGDDFIGGAGFDGATALGAVHLAEAGEEDAQEVVDLGNRAHGGAGIAARGLLFQRNGGREALDLVHVRLVHLGQELAGVGGEGFHITALAFRVDDVEGQCGLPRPRGAAYDHKLIAGDVQREVFEVVLTSTLDTYGGMAHGILTVCPDRGVLRVIRRSGKGAAAGVRRSENVPPSGGHGFSVGVKKTDRKAQGSCAASAHRPITASSEGSMLERAMRVTSSMFRAMPMISVPPTAVSSVMVAGSSHCWNVPASTVSDP